MNKRVARVALAVVSALVIALPIQILVDATPIHYAWLICWLVSFGVVADENSNLFVRGFLFLILSVTCGMLGVGYAKAVETEWLWLVEYVSNIMLLAGSGVGANFMAQHFLDKRTKT
ncbi:hypothetical protein RAL05_004514 [Vibrio vulnificus]|nr:hypothetical protein [Vibrio vulnificus]